MLGKLITLALVAITANGIELTAENGCEITAETQLGDRCFVYCSCSQKWVEVPCPKKKQERKTYYV